MIMRKLLFALLPVTALLAGSCTDEKDQPVNTSRVSGTMPTVMIPTDVNKPAEFVTDMLYSFTNYYGKGVWTVAVNNIHYNGLPVLSFESPEIVPSSSDKGVHLGYYSQFPANNNMMVNSLGVLMTNSYNYYIDYPENNPPLGTLIVASFNLANEYTAKTITPRCYFAGNTVSKYESGGEHKTFTTDKPIYYMDIDLDAKKADMVIYNAQFAPEMPSIPRMQVLGLTVEPDRTYGYRIKGSGIAPIAGEGANAVPYPAFTFYDLEFHPISEDLTQGQLTFRVGERYSATFRGSYLKK